MSMTTYDKIPPRTEGGKLKPQPKKKKIKYKPKKRKRSPWDRLPRKLT